MKNKKIDVLIAFQNIQNSKKLHPFELALRYLLENQLAIITYAMAEDGRVCEPEEFVIEVLKQCKIEQLTRYAREYQQINVEPQPKIAKLNTDYDLYLESIHWQEMKKRAVDERKYQTGLDYPTCQLCNSKKKLNVHHNNYENLGCEKLSDLTMLCNRCHKLHHAGPASVKFPSHDELPQEFFEVVHGVKVERKHDQEYYSGLID